MRASMPAAELQARVAFSPLAADRARREWWLGIVKEQREGRSVVLTLATVEWGMLVSWLLSFGRQAHVLAPDSLRRLLVDAAKDAIAHHLSGDPQPR